MIRFIPFSHRYLWRISRHALLLSTLVFFLMVCGASAHAADFEVTSAADTNDGTCGLDGANDDCTLREAITAANALAGTDTISIPLTSVITLGGSLPDVSSNLTIQGTSPTGTTTVDAASLFRHFMVTAGTTVILSRLRLINGHDNDNGGALLNEGTLTINNCTLSSNSSGTFGGAIRNNGTLTVNNSTFNGNTSNGFGGAIFNAGTLTLTSSTLTDNQANDGGGALGDNSGTETFLISHCTIAGNRCLNAGGGGGFDFSGSTSATLNHTILSGNTTNGALLNYATAFSALPSLISHGFNLSDDTPSGLTGSGDQTNKANINLGALADNGGPTQTMAVLSGSAAHNSGNPAFAPPPTTDQRGTGFPRVQGSRIDVGAFEANLPQSGPTFIVNVTTDNDDGSCTEADCSLREAINAANARVGNDSINIPQSDTITLGGALPDLTGNVTIQGISSTGTTTIDAAGVTRHFVVTAGTTVTLTRLRLINGQLPQSGGAISNSGTLTLNNCTLSGNSSTNNTSAGNGGAINNNGTLTINNSTLSGNSSTDGNGGAIFNSNSGTLTINNSTLSGNSSRGSGGAIFNRNGTTTINNSTLSGNSTTSGHGGAILSGNNLTLNSSTLTDNQAVLGGGALQDRLGNETFVINHCTIAGNRSLTAGSAGGIGCFNSTNITMTHTILAGNTANGTLRNYGTNSGTLPPIISQGFNLSDDAPSGLTGSGDQINKANINLGALANNGGPTQTMALLSGSAAINAGNPTFGSTPATDQRGPGFKRVQGGRIDTGAFEAFSLAINDVSVLEGNSVNFAVTLSAVNSQNVTVNYVTANGGATAPGDYTAKTGTVTITAGQTTGIINLATVGDTLDELDENFFITLSAPTNAIITDAQGRGVIVDNDSQPSVTINDVSLTEGETGTQNATFTVSLSAASGKAISINAIPFNGSARSPADYVTGGARLVFAPGETTKNFALPVKGDLLDESNETFFVILSSPVNCSIGRARGTGTIVDNDAGPSITVDNVSIGEGNAGQRIAAFLLKLSAPSGQVVKVSFATGGGTATAGVDYVAVAPTQVAFTTGSVDAFARVLVNGDVVNEPNKTFFVNLTNPIDATIADNQAVGTILNDDTAPALSIDDVSITEGNSGAKTLSFTVSLSKASGQTITVNFATANGAATTANSDYIARSGTLTFAPGSGLTGTISITINGDTAIEGNETLFVFLSTPTNASIAKARGVGTIINDDSSD